MRKWVLKTSGEFGNHGELVIMTYPNVKKATTMAEREKVEKAVFDAIDELNLQLPKGVMIDKDLDAPLYGKTGKLESLDFVTFIMEVETKVQNEFGVDFMLTDENLLSKEKSPFLTVGSLIEHLQDSLDVDE
ncbi:MAG: hypothetical protein ABIV21_09570 [Pyrinomonadaceae bacterium]